MATDVVARLHPRLARLERTLILCLVRRMRRSAFITAVIVGLLAALGYPFVDLAIACRAPTSEACVWGKAYLPLTLAISVVIVGGTVTALAYTGLVWRRRRQHPSSSNDTKT